MSSPKFFLLFSVLLLVHAAALATSNYEYGPEEYVTVSNGISPDGKFAITAHGGGELWLSVRISATRIWAQSRISFNMNLGPASQDINVNVNE